MKKILKFTVLSAVVLMLAGGLVSCNDKEEENVPFWICLPEDQPYMRSVYVRGYALLFNDSIPESARAKIHQRQEALFRGTRGPNYVAYIVYEGSGIATLRLITRHDIGTYYICNFPYFAKEWGQSLVGQRVFFRGKAFLIGQFESIPPHSGYALGLTLLKKQCYEEVN